MSILFDDSPVMLFASAAGLIVHFELVVPIPLCGPYLRRTKSTHRFLCWLSQGGVERCPRSHRVELCSNIMTLHIGQLPVKLLRLDCKTDFRIIYSGDSDYFSVDGSMS